MLKKHINIKTYNLTLKQLAESAGARFHGARQSDARHDSKSYNGARLLGASSHCPLHGGDNPNAFHLYDGDRRWHCFTRCPPGENDGDLIRFYMLWKKVDFPTALRELGTSLPPPAPNLSNPFSSASFEIAEPSGAWQSRAQSFLDYARSCLLHPQDGLLARRYLLLERGLDDQACETFLLGLNPRDLHDNPSSWGMAGSSSIFLPRGLVIPRFFRGRLLGVKIRRPVVLSRQADLNRQADLDRPVVPNRPLIADPLSQVFEPLALTSSKKTPKFLSVKGSQSGLFGCDTWLGYPTLLLVEGEWDCMLAWRLLGDLCDVATLGSAAQGLSLREELELYAYRRIFSVYDADLAGANAALRFQGIARLLPLLPPAHDLCDYWRQGGDLRLWFLHQGVLEKAAAPSSGI